MTRAPVEHRHPKIEQGNVRLVPKPKIASVSWTSRAIRFRSAITADC
jgi:hypothetical protein